MPDQHHAPPVDASQTADDRRVVGEGPVAGERQEIVGDAGEIILKMRPFRMPRDLRLLPRRQLGISVAQQLVGLALKLADLCIDVDRTAARGLAQLGDAGFKLRNRLFEIEVGQHRGVRVGEAASAVNEYGLRADGAR